MADDTAPPDPGPQFRVDVDLDFGSDLDPERRFWRRRFDSISTQDWCALLRFYRVLRIRIPYAAPGSAMLDGNRSMGCSYGLDRDDARSTLTGWAHELDWYEYLGSK